MIGMMKKGMYILAIMAILLACKKDEPAVTATIEGVVQDGITKQPLEGATVTIDGINAETITAQDGTFSFSGLSAGSFIVLVKQPGYGDKQELVAVTAGQTAEVSFAMTKVLPTFSPTSVTLDGNSPSKTIEISNPGGGQMALTFIPSQTWIIVDQSSMTIAPFETKDLTISVDLTAIDDGAYDEEVMVIVDGFPLTIPVSVFNVEPADVVWQNWYLSVPINNGSGKATSIYYEDIVNDNLTPAEKEYFYYDGSSGSYVFWTKFTGYTTSGFFELDKSKYCRTELREYWRGVQDTDDNWFFDTGETHIMESTLNVDFVEGSRRRTFVAQIHGKKSTMAGIDNGPATVKVLWESGEIEVEYYVAPANPDGEWTSATNAKSARIRVDDEKFTIKLKVDDGVLSWALECEAKGVNQDYVVLYDYASNGYHYDNYFKTGNYFQWDEDYEKAAQVKLYKVTTSHF